VNVIYVQAGLGILAVVVMVYAIVAIERFKRNRNH
jgi:hypothetical protein